MESAFDDYQAFTRTTAIYQEACKSGGERILYCLLGLVGESGEIAEKVKKVVRTSGMGSLGSAMENPTFRRLMVKECGDSLWYLARLADEMGVPLSEVAETNVKKLSDRKERGVLHSEGDER